MENMENQGFGMEPEHIENIPQPPVEKRRRSPYENSPYIMSHRPVTAEVPQASAPDPKKKRSAKRFWGKALSFVLGAAVMTGVYFAADSAVANQVGPKFQAMQEQINVLQEQLDAKENVIAGNSVSGTPNTNADGGLTPGQVYAMNEKSVVLIETDMATGSGFIITEDGYVVTNHHVIADAWSIHVILYNNSRYAATLVGSDETNDVAVLKMEGEGFHAAKLGSSDDLIVGDQVVAIGNPLGELTSTLTVGFVSAKERDVYTDGSTINMMQTDCAINSGNSGGPLFNMKGEVVGITTAKYSGTSDSGASIEGIGFAIPMDDVAGLVEDIMEFGYVKSPYLGVNIYNVDPDTSRMYNVPMGCLVDSVVAGGSAAEAGVKASDIITALGGYQVDSITDLTRALRKFEVGDTTTITIYRSGQELVLNITLGEKPREEEGPSFEMPNMPSSGSYEEWFEFFFGD